MGQFAYKKDLLAPVRKTLTEQLVADLRLVPERQLLAFAKRFEGGWHHKDKFLHNAKRLLQTRVGDLAADAADAAMPASPPLPTRPRPNTSPASPASSSISSSSSGFWPMSASLATPTPASRP